MEIYEEIDFILEESIYFCIISDKELKIENKK